MVRQGVDFQRRENATNDDSLVIAVTTAIAPVLALAGNQEVAEQIAQSLRNSGRLNDYKISVKYQDGTAFLSGRVGSQEQANTALKLVYQAPGVTRVVNELVIAGNEQTQPVTQELKTESKQQSETRRSDVALANRKIRCVITRKTPRHLGQILV